MFSALYYLVCVVLCVVVLLLSLVALVVCYPFDPGRRVVHELSRVLTRIFFFIPPLWRHRVIGVENADPEKAYIIVLNHNAMIDIPSLYFVRGMNFRWVSKREVFRLPFFGQFLLLHGDIPIDRGHGSEALKQMIERGRVWIKRGVSISIFPEGTRSKDGEIHRFKSGAFILAKECDVEILPVVLDGTRTVFKKNRLFNWRNTITVKVLEPVPVEEVRSKEAHDLMAETQERMCNALKEIRETK